MKPSPSILSATSRLFSSAVFRDLATKGRSALFARLACEAGLIPTLNPIGTVGDLFDNAFAVLRRGENRDEYVYKAALTHKILLGRHSLRTAVMLNEFRVGTSKADLVILNGTATVYEIKSERDSLSRLEKQLCAYRDVFPSVYVMAGENHIASVISMTNSNDGILALSQRNQISVVRQAIDDPERLKPAAIFETLRADEAKFALAGLGIRLPAVPNTKLYGVLREAFEGLDRLSAHRAMVNSLKQKRDLRALGDLVSQLPSSLQPAALSVPLRKIDHDRLVRAVGTPLREALAWA
ncbi:sce7726 family protein [Xanthobacter flavus]|uniref:sce7726 family protein n=1 Tax=Xanthobacter flavus TaxID=281 RepID=UPI00372BA1B2